MAVGPALIRTARGNGSPGTRRRRRPHLATPALALAVLGTGACGQRTPPAWSSGATSDSARAFVEAIPDRLRRGGPAAWLEVFDTVPGFFMASDGDVAFTDPAAARTFLSDFAPTVAAMELVWTDLRIEPLAPGLASFAAPYRERIEMRSGDASSFGGYVTGVARHRAGGWKLQHLHWSSPVATGG